MYVLSRKYTILLFAIIIIIVALSSKYIIKLNTSKFRQNSIPRSIPRNRTDGKNVRRQSPTFTELNDLFNDLEKGGCHQPSNFTSNSKVAIVVPFRDRDSHLRTFLFNMHPFLQRQQLVYCIFVVEQSDRRKFNRAKLFNVGFVESLKYREFDCFVFHDVDLIPEDDRNLYHCLSLHPRHLSVAIDVKNYKLIYSNNFGGVCALTKEHMQRVNGFSNVFWGWGGEDDDMFARLKSRGLNITRSTERIARYSSLRHSRGEMNPDRFRLLNKSSVRSVWDGLNNLKYNVINIERKKLYTLLQVEL